MKHIATIILALAALLLACPTTAQAQKASGSSDTVYTMAEVSPTFNGNLSEWLAQNLQYPTEAAENGISGRVVVRFVVEKDGSVTNAKVVRSVDPSLDMEALRVVRQMPKWNPGTNNGKTVRAWMYLPITFNQE